MTTPVLETDRLVLKPLDVSQADLIYERWTSDDRVSRFVRWSTHKNVDDTKIWLQQEEKMIDSEDMYQWAFCEKESGYIFGCGGLHRGTEGVLELGYNIMCDHWNKGFTTEAAKRIVRFATEELGNREITAWHAKENPASGAVLKKCGFIYEKDIMSEKFDRSTVFDCMFYRYKIE